MRLLKYFIAASILLLVLATVWLIRSKHYEIYGVGLFILLSSLIAVFFGFIGWIVSSKIAVTTNTVNAIYQSRLSDHLDKQLTIISNEFPLGTLIRPEDVSAPASAEVRTSIFKILNHLEFISLCICEGHYNERLCKLFYRGIFKSNYIQTRQVIDELQQENPLVFSNFEYVVKKWNPDLKRINA